MASSPSRPGSDVVRFGGAIVLAVLFGVVQVFVVPRRLPVVTFGEYRLFLVYSGYLGLLHLGLADGAFLRWAGRTPAGVRREWPQVLRWLLIIDGALLAVALLAAAVMTKPLPQILTVGFAAAALCMNAATLCGYALQATGDFRAAGRVTVAAPAAFVVAVVLLPIHTLATVLGAYVSAYLLATSIALWHLTRVSAEVAIDRPAGYDRPALRALLRNGAPVLGANLAAGVSQFADRILVSIVVPIAAFAQYGFAASTMIAVSAATQALSRVALSHAARHPRESRTEFVAGFYALVAAANGAALAGLPLFEELVGRLLPAYVSALPIVRALAVGAPFWIAVHVIVVGTLQSHGLVRRQLAVELAGLACVGGACGVCLVVAAPLWVIAAAASAAAVVTWFVGLAVLASAGKGASAAAPMRFVLMIAAQQVAALVALTGAHGAGTRTLEYIVIALLPTWVAARSAREHGWN